MTEPGPFAGGVRPRPLVLGLGNFARRDDGCGREVARRLAPELAGRADAVEYGADPAGILDLWDGRSLVIAVDAVRTGEAPGTILRLEFDGAREGPEPPPSTSTHGWSFAEAYALGRALDRLPQRLVLYGIEAGDLSTGTGFSAPVDRAVDAVIARVSAELAGPLRPPSEGARGAHA